MSEQKPPPGDEQQPTTDELFDREHLSDSDSEFLAELDRVLTSEPDTASTRASDIPASEGKGSELEDVFAINAGETQDELSGMMEEYEHGLDLADEENSLDLASTPDDEFEKALQTSSEDALLQAELENNAAPDTPADDLKNTGQTIADHSGIETYSEMDLDTSAEELDWNDIPDTLERDYARQPPVEPTLYGEAQQDELPPVDENPMGNSGTGHSESMQAVTVPATAVEPERPVVQTAAAEAVEPVGPVPTVDDKPASNGSGSGSGGSLWTGVAALLGLLGIAAGGSGLWMANDMASRLTQLQSPAKAQAALPPPAAPHLDPLPLSAEDTARISDLEQATRRLEKDLGALGSQLESGLADQQQRMTETLSDVQSSLSELQRQIQGLSADNAASERQLQQVSASPPTAVNPGSAEVEPVTEIIPTQAAKVVEEQVQAVPTDESTSVPTTKPEPTSSSGPRWSVNLQSFQRKGKAEQVRKRLNADGIPAEIGIKSSKGKTWYRVKVSGFPSIDQAKAYANDIRSRPGLSSVWIGRD